MVQLLFYDVTVTLCRSIVANRPLADEVSDRLMGRLGSAWSLTSSPFTTAANVESLIRLPQEPADENRFEFRVAKASISQGSRVADLTGSRACNGPATAVDHPTILGLFCHH